MDIIRKFCEGADSIRINTTSLAALYTQTHNIDVSKDEIWRSRCSAHDMCYFNLNLGFREKVLLTEQIKYMRTIELFYPDTFSFRFDGKEIEVIAKIPIKKEFLGIYGRYNGLYSFVRMLRKHLLEILKYRDYNTYNIDEYVKSMIISTGSVRLSNHLYVIDVSPDEKQLDILNRSKHRRLNNTPIKELNMKFWVKEINPDYFKNIPKDFVDKKYPIDDNIFSKYPQCITDMCNMPKKGNYIRFLLSTFFLSIHHERDAKHQLDIVLSDEEREHMNRGNCKDQWRTIVAKSYPCPSCKTLIEHGYCNKDCGRPIPKMLDIEGNNGN